MASVSCSRRRLTKWRIDRDYKRGLPKRLANLFQESLALRVPVKIVEPGALPRFELKAKRWIAN